MLLIVHVNYITRSKSLVNFITYYNEKSLMFLTYEKGSER